VAAHWIQVAEALRSAIATALGVAVERRYSAYYDKQAVVDGKYLVVGASSELEGKRGIDQLLIAIDVGYQRALPDPTESQPDPLGNITWLDAESEKVQAIKDLFAAGDELSPGGSLRNMDFAGATYLRWTNSPLYRPDLLLNNSIYTSVIRCEFRVED
jgi:hypothetical protein